MLRHGFPLESPTTHTLCRCAAAAQGHPIFLERLGKLDGRRIEEEGLSDEDILAYHLREMEFMGWVVTAGVSSRAVPKAVVWAAGTWHTNQCCCLRCHTISHEMMNPAVAVLHLLTCFVCQLATLS